MIRFLVRTAILLVSNTVGLLLASLLVDDFDVNASGFITAVIIFTAAVLLLEPFLATQFKERSPRLLGAVSLFATLVALLLTDLLADGLDVEGLGGWLGATFLVWLVALLVLFLAPYFGLKKYLEERRD